MTGQKGRREASAIPDLQVKATKIAQRASFPAGLIQPDNSYRFGLEALLLAAYALQLPQSEDVCRIADLGCGCGASLFAMALARKNCLCLGIDREEELISAARANATLLNLTSCCAFIQGDLAETALLAQAWQNKCQLVIANPPWRILGRKSQKPLRQRALWAEPESFGIFCRAAALLLEPLGAFSCIIANAVLKIFSENLQSAGMFISSLLPVKAHSNENARVTLITCRKGPPIQPFYDKPLILWREDRKNPHWTEQATLFCPWLN